MLNEQAIGAHVSAALGPTNTGKTWLAVSRMLSRSSGCIGLPLRLLAREVYDRIVAEKGEKYAALVTGEEKIIPKTALWYACTVESMPANRNGVPFAFVGIDEVQLADDPKRGHLFTDRILHMRGREETMLMGSARMQNLLHKLKAKNVHEIRERFSPLKHIGHARLDRLPKRSAIVAFSREQVYSLAENLRQSRGGAAIVMGGLSPQTRNAQVQLFQSGEVDYLVATDAIGLGLNMDIHHVALAQTYKFDGRLRRDLFAHELAQIAGRAGRGSRPGSFGTTGTAQPFNEAMVRQIENNQFTPVTTMLWRNSSLDFATVSTVQASLALRPDQHWLRRVESQVDERAWQYLSGDENWQNSTDQKLLRRLWEICQVPDFRKIGFDPHLKLLEQLAEQLLTGHGELSDDWFENRLQRLNSNEGNVDDLASRLANIRTWSYCANRGNWLKSPAHWQGRCAKLETQLSDALHEKLVARFVDKRTSILLRSLHEQHPKPPELAIDGSVFIAGHLIGHLTGFSFVPLKEFIGQADKTIVQSANKLLQREIKKRMQSLIDSKDEAFSLNDAGQILWQQNPVAALAAGANMLAPSIEILQQSSEQELHLIRQRLELWLKNEIQSKLSPLIELQKQIDTSSLDPAIRGLAYRLVEQLGSLDRRSIAKEVRELSQEQRASLRLFGVRFGEFSLFLPALLRPAPSRLLALLLAFGPAGNKRPFFAPPGLTSMKADGAPHSTALSAVGLRKCGHRLIRLDMLERVGTEIRSAREKSKNSEFQPNLEMVALLGCSKPELAEVLSSLGYQKIKTVLDDKGEVDELSCIWQMKPFQKAKTNLRKAKSKQTTNNKNAKLPVKKPRPVRQKKIDPDSPFAVLQILKQNKP